MPGSWPCRKLTAACLAAELLAAAPSQQSESACQGIPANKAALQGDAARQSEASIEIRLLPHRIRQRYQDILLDWTISTVCKSAGTTLKAGEGAGGTAVQASLHLDVRAWRLLHALLHVRAAAPNAMLRESVLSTMIAVCSDTHATGDDVQSLLPAGQLTPSDPPATWHLKITGNTKTWAIDWRTLYALCPILAGAAICSIIQGMCY